MNAVRWTFTDRRTGQAVSVPHPTNKEEQETLKLILHNVAER